MLIIDNVMLPNSKLIVTTEGQLTLYFIKEYMYQNSMYLMLSWWQSNLFYIKYSILKDEINIIITDFGNSESYGSIFWARCMVHNTYTGPRRFKIDHSDQTQLLVMKDDINFHYKKDSFNLFPHVFYQKIINNITIKYSFSPRKVYAYFF